ncbi:hypothetical protein [Pseudoalteromonas rubra]|uniref:hypothetical protein n=1 Tax=Pseudoalteromonas rubra TaxID=43658 RepID=UPI00148665AA|nr:hypothetical protein [Pseudoalteromonas rubra]
MCDIHQQYAEQGGASDNVEQSVSGLCHGDIFYEPAMSQRYHGIFCQLPNLTGIDNF